MADQFGGDSGFYGGDRFRGVLGSRFVDPRFGGIRSSPGANQQEQEPKFYRDEDDTTFYRSVKKTQPVATRRRLVWARPIRWVAVPRARPAGAFFASAALPKPVCGFTCLLITLILAILVVLAGFLATILTGILGPEGVNPCLPLGCQYSCRFSRNAATEYECYCADGFELHVDGKTCTDIDECAGPNECETGPLQCVNTEGSFKCGCNEGYTKNGENCEDVNECEEMVCFDGSTCVNTDGGYDCLCQPNYLYNKTTDECVKPSACASKPCPSGCLDTADGYECVCYPGFIYDEQTGTCKVIPPQCDCDPSAKCVFLRRRYICECDKSQGLFLAKDRKSCIAFDLYSGGITNDDGVNFDFGETTSSYNLTEVEAQTLTFTCTVNSTLPVHVGDTVTLTQPALIWLNNADYLVPGNPYLDPDKYTITPPVDVGADGTVWQTTLTVNDVTIPDDLGKYKCKFVCELQSNSLHYEVTAEIPVNQCIRDLMNVVII